MKRIDLIEFNKELLQKLKQAGIKLEDYKYCKIYQDYMELQGNNASRKEIMLTLSQRHGLTDRQIYNIINHLEKPI